MYSIFNINITVEVDTKSQILQTKATFLFMYSVWIDYQLILEK